ncbi:hypothetical protein DNAM5_3 [Haloarcula californiae tailed virus 1]|uniref:Uncharacterized protein n=1 Tax=Haloarcula californiae tailed virus 1 TaxID=1273746 RepID=R4THS8_9CAUD|nr:hypothetical protein M202_gp003 [Haloarcula californiae tailed virus 1]AGM11866.1 hypothetical protein DNAM5_3 [Haloarcula californiae tailed virus 1]UBF22987.1 hypothetical protein HCTV-16_gp4 [Haloarcula virus HCTV-16]
MNSEQLAEYIDYFIPREVLGPVVIVFSLENVIDRAFSAFVPDAWTFAGWSLIFVISVVLVALWGTTDDDYDDLEERLDEMD